MESERLHLLLRRVFIRRLLSLSLHVPLVQLANGRNTSSTVFCVSLSAYLSASSLPSFEARLYSLTSPFGATRLLAMTWNACRASPQEQRRLPFVVFSILLAYRSNSLPNAKTDWHVIRCRHAWGVSRYKSDVKLRSRLHPESFRAELQLWFASNDSSSCYR